MPPSLRTASLWFGPGATDDPRANCLGHLLTCAVAAAGCAAGAAFWLARGGGADGAVSALALELLFDLLIPGMAGVSCMVSVLLALRAALARGVRAVAGPGAPDFGRKGLLVTVSAMLFATSTFYRSLNIASEGAALCRSKPTVFNAPVTGRSVATVGEIALVVQASVFVEQASLRLGARRGPWSAFAHRYTSAHWSTVGPVLCAELFSWSGVLRLAGPQSHNFFCAEYVMWMLIAFTWAWDSSELLYKARTLLDKVSFAVLLLTGVVLFFFNAFLELPHFFSGANRDETIAGLWECAQAADSPLWKKRLPFFVLYFVGASWISVAGSHRFVTSVRRMLDRPDQKDD